MTETTSAIEERPLPEVRLACFCETAIEGVDGVWSAIRIYNALVGELRHPEEVDPQSAPPPITFQTTLFFILDAIRDWSSTSLGLALQPDGKEARQAISGLRLSDRDDADSVHVCMNVGLALEREGLVHFDVTLDDRPLFRRSLQVMIKDERLAQASPSGDPS